MILNSLIDNHSKNRKSLSVLIDPDKNSDKKSLERLIDVCKNSKVDFILVGGSLLVHDNLNETVKLIKGWCDIPVILFPASISHIDKSADGILFLSLISGRNPDLLIGQHVAAAPILKKSNLEVLSTGYILIGNDSNTTVAHISRTFPIPTQKADIALCTAMAGELLGMKLIYLDAGSGAKEEVPPKMISEVRKSIALPLIVGGGIDTYAKAENAYSAGADMLVIGTAVEKNRDFISEVASVKDRLNAKRS